MQPMWLQLGAYHVHGGSTDSPGVFLGGKSHNIQDFVHTLSTQGTSEDYRSPIDVPQLIQHLQQDCLIQVQAYTAGNEAGDTEREFQSGSCRAQALIDTLFHVRRMLF